jgi:hypothetical protein
MTRAEQLAKEWSDSKVWQCCGCKADYLDGFLEAVKYLEGAASGYLKAAQVSGVHEHEAPLRCMIAECRALAEEPAGEGDA